MKILKVRKFNTVKYFNIFFSYSKFSYNLLTHSLVLRLSIFLQDSHFRFQMSKPILIEIRSNHPSFPIEKFHNQKLTIYSQLYFQFYHQTILTLCPTSSSPSFFQCLFQIFIPLLHINFPVISFLSFLPLHASCPSLIVLCSHNFFLPLFTSHTHFFYIRSIYRHFRRNKLSN